MVTAPAPALPDSHALPQAAAGAASNSSNSPTSFQSVYQSLPVQPGSSLDSQISQLSNSKAPAGKKTPSKGTDDNLAAIVSPANVDPSSPQPLALSHPSFSLAGRDHATVSEPAANEPTQSSLSRQEASFEDKGSTSLNSRIQSGQPVQPAGVEYIAKADIRSMIQGARASAQTDLRSSLQTGVSSAAPSTVSADQLAARRAPAVNSQAPSSAPSFSIGAPVLPTIPEVTSPDPAQPATPSRSTRTAANTTPQPAIDPALFTKGLAATLAPRQDNLAFSLKMAETNSTARRAQQATQPETADRNGIPAQAKSQERTPTFTTSASAPHTTAAPANVTGEAAAVASTVNPSWNVAATTPQVEIHTETQFTEPREPANLSTVAAMHEAQHILPDAPRPTAAAEIMLQLGGKDQAAAIRVTDRAGTVNVSVHAADADVRTTLRSNLGDLASQLSHQGWKTEVVKTGTVLTRGETSQDPQQGGQRSPNQQQPSSQGERQQQRDRRSASGQWLAEFEEQASGNSRGTN